MAGRKGKERQQILAGEKKMRIRTPKPLHIEDYQFFINHPDFPDFTVPQLNQIIHMHGYNMFRTKEGARQALAGLDNLLEPHRSTLNETLSQCGCVNITIDQVNADLEALQWQETPVHSLQVVSPFDSNNDSVCCECDLDDNDNDNVGRRIRGRKAKVRKVFDAVHVTKPRSKKSVPKRRLLNDIYKVPCLG